MKEANNGVNLANMQGLLDAVKANPQLANLTFKAKSTWKGGTRTESTVSELIAGGQNIARGDRKFSLVSDEPPQLGGTDANPSPVELLCAALCGCMTGGIATNAALFQTAVDAIDIELQADFDLHGVLGLKNDVPNGANEIRMKIRIKGPDAEKLKKAKETIDRKSPVKNTIETPVRIISEVEIVG